MSKDFDIDRLREMIPFYVNGSLSHSDRQILDTALATMPELRADLDAETRLQEQYRSAMARELETGTAPDAKQIEKLMASSQDSDGAARAAPPSGLAGALAFLNPRNWKPAVTLALAAAAVGQLAVIGSQSGTIEQQNTQIAKLEADNYALASGQGACEGEASIMVEISETARWSELTALFAGEKLLVTRSTAQGILMLRTSGTQDRLDAVIARLEASSLITSAARVS